MLQKLHEAPTKATYEAHKTEITTNVMTPLKTLLKEVVAQLPADIIAKLETEKNIFSRILKNDYGKGGAPSTTGGHFIQKVENARKMRSYS